MREAARLQSVQRDRIRESAAELGEHLRCGQCVAAAAVGLLACAAAVSSAAATWSLVTAPLPPPPLPPPAACWETMLGDLLMSAGCSAALCMVQSTRAAGERERWVRARSTHM